MQTLKALTHKSLYPQALTLSLSLSTTFHSQNPNLTSTIFALFIKSAALLHPIQSASLITHFSRAAQLPRAAYLLRRTQSPDVVVFNSLISAYARRSRPEPEPAFRLFNELRRSGLEPDVVSFSSLLRCCGDLVLTEVVHLGVLKLGFGGNLFLISGLIEKYSRFGGVASAEECFNECLKFDGVVWSVMINGYLRNGELEKGRECFMRMKGVGVGFNEFTLSNVLGAVFDVNEGEQIHGYSVKKGYLYGFSMHLSNAIMVMYGRFGCKSDAVKVFDEMPERDVVSWTARIGVAFDCFEAFEVFERCFTKGFEVNEYTFINVLSMIEGDLVSEMGKQIHPLVLKLGYSATTSVCNALMSMYSRTGQMDDARQMFDEMPERDSVSWNSMINGYSQRNLSNEAVELFSTMRKSSLAPNENTLASVLDVIPNSNSINSPMQVHLLTLKLGFTSADSIISRLITAYGKCNGIDKSKLVFDEIDNVNTIHVNAMAGAYDHCRQYNEIQTLFLERRNSSLDVDIVTFGLVLKSCGALSDLHRGKAAHSLAIKTGISHDKFIESTVIDVYCKCGSIDDAGTVFRDVKTDNLVAWNAMIMGYAQFGCYRKAHDLFMKLPKFGMKPDEITYLGVLSSCSHAGLVREARYHLRSMFELHGIIPCLEHYACVVDVLGKVGRLADAKKTIDLMPVFPDARIWQILLSACSVYGNLEIGLIAARELAALQPENESGFVLLSNLYASAGMWSNVRRLRREMKDKVVCKEPGSSWIQVKGSVRYFFADDGSGSRDDEIYVELESLRKQMIRFPREQDGFFTNFVT